MLPLLPAQSSTTFKLKVTTGSAPGSGFDGAVYARLSTWWSDGKEVQLTSDKGADAFAAGATEEFLITASDMWCVVLARDDLWWLVWLRQAATTDREMRA